MIIGFGENLHEMSNLFCGASRKHAYIMLTWVYIAFLISAQKHIVGTR